MNEARLKKRLIWTFVGCVGLLIELGIGTLLLAMVVEDGHESLTTDTRSTQLATSAERVAFLRRYLKLRTPVADAAFHIVWHDNSGFPPGPSDWYLEAAVLVKPADGPTWLDKATPLMPADSAS